MVKVCETEIKVPPPQITWKVVEHRKDNTGTWVRTGQLLKMKDRAAALAVVAQYK
jgi:hypothetical protein